VFFSPGLGRRISIYFVCQDSQEICIEIRLHGYVGHGNSKNNCFSLCEFGMAVAGISVQAHGEVDALLKFKAMVKDPLISLSYILEMER
jgi:hypothetical protein